MQIVGGVFFAIVLAKGLYTVLLFIAISVTVSEYCTRRVKRETSRHEERAKYLGGQKLKSSSRKDFKFQKSEQRLKK